MNRQALADRLLAAFLDELEEQVRTWNAELLALEAEGDDAQAGASPHLRALFRVAHTMKGAARAANVPLVEAVCHALEALLAAARDGTIRLGAGEFALFYRAGDAFADALRLLRTRARLDGSSIALLAEELTASSTGAGGIAARLPIARPKATAPAPDGEPVEPGGQAALIAAPAPRAAAPPPPAAPPEPPASVRVRGDKVDALVASVAALAPVRAGAAALALELGEVEARLRRTGNAAAAEVKGVAAAAERHARALATAIDDHVHLVRQLRIRPFADIVEGLPRVVRDVASAGQKRVRLDLRGTEVEADRAVFDALRDPILHLVRNAVDHGIERPEVRRSRGKPETGTVGVSAAIRGDRLVVTVVDDGGGVDAPAVRARLAQLGRLAIDDDRQLARAMLEGGFSTRAEATAISGRGVGLDVARAALERLGGSIDVRWSAGGTEFTLDAPISLARMRAVVARVGTQRLAVPSAHVARVRRTVAGELETLHGRHVLPVGEGRAPIPVQPLGSVLGPPIAEAPPAEPMPTLVVGSGDEALALLVDALEDEAEIVLRPLPPGHQVSPHVAGAAMLADGAIALVLNAASLVAAGRALPAPAIPAASTAPGPARRRVLVVDDSITTRTLEQSVLQSAGYEVTTAVDGVDALRRLEAESFNVVVSDVEMPRLDGFGLCEAIRASKKWAHLPVVLVTAQEAPEDRARGLAAGADAYVGKSGFDQQELLELVRQLAG